MKWFSDYMDWNPQSNVGTISFLIIIKMYIMQTVLIIYLLAKQEIIIEGPEFFIKTLASLMKVEVYIIFSVFTFPLLYNLIVWYKKRK